MSLYKPSTKEELKKLVQDENINLCDIDTSLINDMRELFKESKRKNFEGIENWDVSNVTDMKNMFWKASYFNQDISNWDVYNVTDMGLMFCEASSFNQDINNWNIDNIKYICSMFNNTSMKELPSWYKEYKEYDF